MFLLFLAFPQIDLRPGWDLYVGGDIMLNGISSSRSPFRELAVPASAVFVANLEIPLTDTSARTPRKTAAEIAARDQYVLKASPGHARHLAAANFDLLTLGNNHTMDGGVPGWQQNKKMLTSVGITFCGAGDNVAEADAHGVTTAPDGTRIAVLSMLSFRNPGSNWKCGPATDTAPGISALAFASMKRDARLEEFKRRVEAARLDAEVVVVMPHWGIEKQPLPSDVQVEMGRQWIDAGADFVMGSHPHVLQPGELYKGKPIVYSLGNFINPGGGRAAIYKFRMDKARMIGLEILETRYSGHRVRVVPTGVGAFRSAEGALQRRFSSKESKPLLGTLSQR
jgi:Bacterial capsule synthesis protein PGA_cap